MPYFPPVIQTSAQLAAQLSDETGSGASVFGTSPTLSSPVVGTQTAGDNSTKAASTAYADALLSDTAFASSWNAVTGIGPSKNAVYDWAHTFDTDDDGLPNNLDAVSGAGSGIIAVDASNVLSATGRTVNGGTSTSTTPGTNVATITAGNGYQFVAIRGYGSCSSTANSQITCTITYSDATTTSDTTAAASTSTQFINDEGINRQVTGIITTHVAHSAKRITVIAFTTAGVGNGTRLASVSAIEIPQ